MPTIRVSLKPLLKKMETYSASPLKALRIPKGQRWGDVQPMKRHKSEGRRDVDDRVLAYDIPRVKYFKDKFETGSYVSPIVIDNQYLNKLTLVNGYHRLAGAILAQVDSILVMADDRESFVQLTSIKKRKWS